MEQSVLNRAIFSQPLEASFPAKSAPSIYYELRTMNYELFRRFTIVPSYSVSIADYQNLLD